ncbi:MAG: hypothetical protein WDN45_05270 [Caulobacteraceae bacterium]
MILERRFGLAKAAFLGGAATVLTLASNTPASAANFTLGGPGTYPTAITPSHCTGASASPVDNSATLSSLNNANAMSGSGDALVNETAGSITTLTNTCSILGNIGLNNRGTIGSLNNQGIFGGGTGHPTTPITGGKTQGIQNSGQIGAITNSGGIYGDDAVAIDTPHTGNALTNLAGGSIGTLTNTGVILSAGERGISNAGAISVLDNSGVIWGNSGARFDGYIRSGIYNTGAIGQLFNRADGVIFGGIYNTVGSRIDDIENFGSLDSIQNFGLINSVSLSNIRNTSLSLFNSGSISSIYNNSPIRFGDGISGFPIFLNTGTISNLHNDTHGDLTDGTLDVLDNEGHIGTIANDGRINGVGVGIANAGSIGAITNSGIVTAGPLTGSNEGAIQNGGSLGVITNTATGQIAGVVAIGNSGALGRIDNAGEIDGEIVNTSANPLVLNGGSGSTFGTLTGYQYPGTPRLNATITSTNADVLFSGNLLLDDALALGAHQLVSTGALQINRSLKLTGGFQQNGGSLIVGVTSLASYGQLQISGAAGLSGAVIALKPLTTGILAAGQTYTVIQAGGALTTTGLSASVPGFSATITTTVVNGQNDLIVTVTAQATSGTTPPQASAPQAGAPQASPPQASAPQADAPQASTTQTAVGSTLNQIASSEAPSAGVFQTSILPSLSALPAAAQARALNQLAPSALGAQASIAASAPASAAIGQHLDAFALQTRGRAYASLDRSAYFADAAPDRRLWGKLVGGGARRDDAPTTSYDASLFGLVFGADLFRSQTILAGAAVSWIDATVDGKQDLSGSVTRLSSYQLTAYATARPGAGG